MAKLKHLLSVIFFLTLCCFARGQAYHILYLANEKDSAALKSLQLDSSFAFKVEADLYIVKLPGLLQSKGYITASIDSITYDTASARIALYLGESYTWAAIKADSLSQPILNAVRWPESFSSGKIDFSSLKLWQQKILDYLEENGHPFGKTYLDNISIEGDKVSATLKVDPGPLYKIDSIRIYGDAKVNNEFLQRYLQITNGSIYSKRRLQNVTKKLSELSYLQEERPSDLTLLGSGSILNLYLKPRKSSQVNALIGFLPNSDQLTSGKKFLLTVDANILLRNALGSGETIGLVWQQLQQKSPRLNLLFEQPYIFHSPFGFNFSFDMYKRDSSFLNINMNLGTTYHIEERKSVAVFLQRRQSIVNNINTAFVIQTKQLPQEADVSSLNLGVGYNFINTDYRFNPRKGNEFAISSSGGTKKIKKNNSITELKDPGNPSFKFEKLYDTVKLKAYQFRVITSATHFLPLGGQSTLKLGVNAGIYQSANYFRNELFQIGGYKLLRGFDEESQFVTQYAIGTVEYRYRIDLNSFVFAFADGGWGKHYLENKKDHSYIGTGLGLSIETKAGIINLAWAVGKRDDTELNLRQSKLHIGFVSYF
jgi:outer membrane protein assembly factor BamA